MILRIWITTECGLAACVSIAAFAQNPHIQSAAAIVLILAAFVGANHAAR